MQSLEQEIANIERELEDLNRQSVPTTSGVSRKFSSASLSQQATTAVPFDNVVSPPCINTAKRTFDNVFFIYTPAGLTTRYHGSSSIFSLTVEVLARAAASSFYQPTQAADAPPASSGAMLSELGIIKSAAITGVSRDTIQSLIEHYMSSINLTYPIIDEGALQADLDAYFSIIATPAFDSAKLKGLEAYQCFRISMLCSIACANKSRHQKNLRSHGDNFYSQATKCVEEITSAVTSQSLQALILLVIYCLFFPQKGNVWKLLDFACRLSIELGYHTEQHLELEDEGQQILRRKTFWCLYTIERMMGQFFGRPSDLPDAIITTELPRISSQTPGAPQPGTVHRLMKLRSGIYNYLYLSTAIPLYDNNWVTEQYTSLIQLFQESEEDAASNSPINIDSHIAFHSSVIFLLQPGILQALSHLENEEPLSALPIESYISACELIQTYRKILQASDPNSEFLSHPITLLSAYTIWVAAMTLMAHCMISIDGEKARVSLQHRRGSQRISQQIDYSNVFELSGSCLILLAWCGERWEGMHEMMDTYQRLSQRLLPELVHRGIY